MRNRKLVCVTPEHPVLWLFIPLLAAVHTNVELIQRRTLCCFTSIDVDVLRLWSPDSMVTVRFCVAIHTDDSLGDGVPNRQNSPECLP